MHFTNALRFLFSPRWTRVSVAVLLIGGGVGCSQQQGTPVAPPQTLAAPIDPATRPAAFTDLQPAQPLAALKTLSPIPVGWAPDPPKHSGEHDHQAWLSPTGRTAYGVIAFHHWLLPLASDRAVLDKFLETMRQTEGEATLISVTKDPKLDGLRFVAEGGLYLVRGNLMTRGTRGWVIYAGTLRRQPLMPQELETAERARERTLVNVSPPGDTR